MASLKIFATIAVLFSSPDVTAAGKPLGTGRRPSDGRDALWAECIFKTGHRDGVYLVAPRDYQAQRVEWERSEFHEALRKMGLHSTVKLLTALRPGDKKKVFMNGDNSDYKRQRRRTHKIGPISERTRCGIYAIFNVLGTSQYEEDSFMRQVPEQSLSTCSISILADLCLRIWSCNLKRIRDELVGEENWTTFLKRQQTGKYIMADRGHCISFDCDKRLVYESPKPSCLDSWRGPSIMNGVEVRRIERHMPTKKRKINYR